MRTFILCTALLAMSLHSRAQNFHVGVFGGASSYSGELNERIFYKKLTHAVVGITGNYELSELLMVRAGLSFTRLAGADRYSRDSFSLGRNLSFESKLTEFSLLGEFYLRDLYQHKWSPYIFAGLAIYHFNPYTNDVNGQKVYLRPLSTEGQGLPGYSDRQAYGLTQLAVPFGGGFKFAINDNLRIGIEVGLRKLFTDYLDDVSKGYVSEQDLLQYRGQQAVDLAYRGDELPNGNPAYPAKGTQRGGSQIKDYYYFGGLHLSFRLGGEKAAGRKSGFGCPKPVEAQPKY